MRRLPALALALTLVPAMAQSQTFTNVYWKLLAIDGQPVDARATLRIDTDNVLAGAAPCNRWMAANRVDLPALQLGGMRSTRMACDALAEEQAFFEVLALMTLVTLDGDQNLILTGPEGRTMEFVLDGADSASLCKTCPPKE